ncbi:MAG: serine protease AprX [Actinomycetota bacterium]|nr:serine protease AprX [Actinomycetota bacterium]
MSVSGTSKPRRGIRGLAALFSGLLLLTLLAGPATSLALAAQRGKMVAVIVRELRGSRTIARDSVVRSGGKVQRSIAIINGFTAMLPSTSISSLRNQPGIFSVDRDRPVHLNSTSDGYDATADNGSMYHTMKSIKAAEFWKAGFTGQGVGVALLDTGVVPVDGMTSTNTDGTSKVTQGPDLSLDNSTPQMRYLDGFGHGTFMAGIIAGKDDGTSPSDYTTGSSFVGIAPDAHLINVKVGASNGVVDVSQVLAGINWVAEHRNDNGLNIRVLNLSFGTDSTQSYLTDPLAYAAEAAWRRFGIVVVTSAGNSQFGTSALNDPATDPYVLAVGSDDTQGTYGVKDDQVSDFSARGNGIRNPDLVAPGRSIVSLRNPGSYIDTNYGSTGRVGDRFFRGSGTSEAAAVTSGAVALLLSQRPDLTPDQVKRILTSSAHRLPMADATAQGNGLLDMKSALDTPTPNCSRCQFYPTSNGLGSLEAARGSVHVGDNVTGEVLTGEQDIFGAPWNGNTWTGNTWTGNTWTGGVWNGNTWTGNTWTGNTWTGNTWTGNTWTGNTWTGNTWTGNTWTGNTWTGNTWTGNTWTGNTWTSVIWDGNTWTGNTWTGNTWTGQPGGATSGGQTPSASTSTDPGWGQSTWGY